MVQGFTYEDGVRTPKKWRGLISSNDVKAIEKYPRGDFDKIR
jgi:hypothetical protein